MAKVILCNAFSIQMLNGDSTLSFRRIGLDESKNLLKGGFVSAIGHADTARVISGLIGEEVPMNRISVSIDPETTLVVAQVLGGRLPEGATTIPEGMEIAFFKVTPV